jgi:hypothetical protein
VRKSTEYLRKSTEYLLKRLQIAGFSDGDKLHSVREATEYLSVIKTDLIFHQLRHVVALAFTRQPITADSWVQQYAIYGRRNDNEISENFVLLCQWHTTNTSHSRISSC